MVIFTTIQSQDFPDVEGDAGIGRVTFPIYAPEASRMVTLIALITWSVFLTALWELGTISGIIFCALGAYAGYRYYHLRGVMDDKSSYRTYNVSRLFEPLFDGPLLYLPVLSAVMVISRPRITRPKSLVNIMVLIKFGAYLTHRRCTK